MSISEKSFGHCYNTPQLFQDVVKRYANRPAISFAENYRLTYAELDRLSNQAARYLLEEGLRKGEPVGLCLEKSASFYILVLAALKIGTPYFALDPRNPASRIASIMEQCKPGIVFSHQPMAVCSDAAPVILCPDDKQTPAFCRGRSEESVPETHTVCGSDPAYIMFTSGSTGTPKGAVMSHDNLLHFIGWATAQYGFTPEDVHTHLNPVYFDNSIFDIYSTLFTGGQLVPFVYETLLKPRDMAERLRTMGCTVWYSVPSMLIFAQAMKVTTPEFFGTLRKIIFGGEGFPKIKLKALMNALGTNIEYHNVSGPTECTCICSTYQVTEADLIDLKGLPALGSLISNFNGYILDGDSPTAPGQTGELCLGGPCVGLGYYKQPALTQRAFVQNPLNAAYREIIYRTGDLVRQNPDDGKLYFVGRKDLQIKHMGYRIELEEIQHALSLCHGVDEAAVIYKQTQGEGGIIAIVAALQDPDLGGLRSELAGHIPKYMMPAKFHFLKRLPKNPNGKTDRQSLIMEYGI